MVRSIVLAALFVLPLPVLGHETPTVDFVAAILLGLSTGATVNTAGDVPATVTRTGPGVFEIARLEGDGATVTVTESVPCVVDFTAAVNGTPVPESARLDSTKLFGVTFTEGRATANGLNLYYLRLKGELGVWSIATPDGTVPTASSNASFRTSVTLAELEAAAAALQGACPAKTKVTQNPAPPQEQTGPQDRTRTR